MANSSTKVCLQSLIRLMYSLSDSACTELAFVTNSVLTLSEPNQRHIKFIHFTGSCQYHPSDRTEASIKHASHAHLRQCAQLFWNHIHVWSSRRCRWQWRYNTLSMTDVNLLPGVERATGSSWQLVVNTRIVSQTLSSDQTLWRWMGSASLPWHRIIQLTKASYLTSVMRALQKQWLGGSQRDQPSFLHRNNC